MKTIFSGFIEDAVRIRKHGTRFHHRAIIDTCGTDEAHRDAIQLIPRSSVNYHNQQFSAAPLYDVKIYDNVIFSEHKLQCVFASDGWFDRLVVKNNLMQTHGKHFITINGLSHGRFENNLDQNGEAVPVQLDNLRIGGGLNGGLWVLSMKGKYEYKKVYADNLIDHRGLKTRKGVKYIKDLELDLFRHEAMKIKASNGNDYAQQAQALALQLSRVA